MGSRNGTGKATTKTPPKKLDLDAFQVEAPTVQIGGADYKLAPFTLGNYAKFAELRKGFETAGADFEKQIAAALEVYRFLLPNVPDAVINALGPDQQEALSTFWLTGAVEQIDTDEEEAKGVVTDPTSPG